MRSIIGCVLIVGALFASGCVENSSSSQTAAPVVYGGKILATLGQNQPATTGPITSRTGITLTVTNQGSEPMRLDSFVGKVNGNDTTVLVDVEIEMETNQGRTIVARQIGMPVNIDTVFAFSNAVVAPGDTVVLRVYMTSANASTADIVQFSGLRIESSGGRAEPPPSNGQPGEWQGVPYLAG